MKQLTNSGQTLTDTYDTDAWGANGSSSGSTVNPFRFGGQFAYFSDADSGLLRLGVRYLDPTHGRFTQRDPVRDVLLPYAYGRNAPARATDRAGLQDEEKCWVYHYRPLLRWEWWDPESGDYEGKTDPTGVEGPFYGSWRTVTVGSCACDPDEHMEWTTSPTEYEEHLVFNGSPAALRDTFDFTFNLEHLNVRVIWGTGRLEKFRESVDIHLHRVARARVLRDDGEVRKRWLSRRGQVCAAPGRTSTPSSRAASSSARALIGQLSAARQREGTARKTTPRREMKR